MNVYAIVRTRSIFPILLTLFIFSISQLGILAQSGTVGTLTGVVKDPNGANLPGVSVAVRNLGTGATRTATTSEDGHWSLPALPIGTYEVSYETTGFKKLIRDRVEVEASVPRTLEEKLEVGDIGAVINIMEGAALITPETSAVARQLSSEQLVEVPTSTRSFTQLLSTEAGVNTELSPVLTNGNGNQSPSVNGTRTTSTSLFFNGVDATNITTNEGSLNDNIAPAPETLQEVKLQTSMYDASTGRSGGGNFQLVTKTGANNFNGNVYYFLQNEKLNANDFFFNKEGIDRPKARRNEGGFTLGGPIVKDRFFFFGGYQYTNAITGFVPTARSTSVTPLALTLLGADRSAQAIATAFNQARDQFRISQQLPAVCAGNPVPAGCLTANDISPLAVRLLNLQNPATGGFIFAAPRAGGRIIPFDRANRTSAGLITTRAFQFGTAPVTTRALFEDNPLVQQLNVRPSEFEQHQFTTRLDGRLTKSNTLTGTFFFSNFPALDSFPDPSSLISPFVLRRADRNRTLAISDQHVFGPTFINEAVFGFFSLNNTRALDEPFLSQELTSEALGIGNPALLFDDTPGTRRLGHFIGRPGTNLSQFSFGGPNDSFNQREQKTLSFSDNVTWIKDKHTFRFGGDFKHHRYDSSLPEEQATEFEKFDSITQLLTGNATEADTQFGITQKSFRFRDYSAYVADDWKVTRNLTLNLGLRYELFMWPTEKQGRIGNFDFDSFQSCFTSAGGALSLCDSPSPGFLVPANVQSTGLGNVDAAVGVTARAANNHTLRGQDKNNFAPRIGFAYSPLGNSRMVVRGGYGIFYDRPSAAFINTVFSNYPFLREIEITVPSGNVPITTAFSQQRPDLPLSSWLPFRVMRTGGAGGSYVIRDNTGITLDPRLNITPAGNIAETFEFRAIDRDLKTPNVHQFNVGVQYELTKNLMFEARYVHTRGRNLLQALAFNQGFDLNDPSTPDHIFERFNQAYVAAGSPNGPLNAGTSARERGLGRAFGFANPFRAGSTATCAGGVLSGVAGAPLDLNLANAITCSGSTLGGGQVINFEARVPILGFNVPEALILRSNGDSTYHGAQFGLTQRLSRGLHFNASYTWAKSLDTSSTDPGSTAGSGKPDVPNTGFVVQGDLRNLEANRAVSDFDRTHRFSLSFVYDVPSFGSKFFTGWQLSGFFQAQTGTPYSIFSPEPEIQTAPQYADLVRGSGGLYRLGFGRPALCGSLAELSQSGSDITEDAFNRDVLCSPLGQNGSLGRNVLRAPAQSRFDFGVVKSTKITETTSFEFGWDVFNVFNRVNFASPDFELGSPDFGRITSTVGGPRVMQFKAKFKF